MPINVECGRVMKSAQKWKPWQMPLSRSRKGDNLPNVWQRCAATLSEKEDVLRNVT